MPGNSRVIRPQLVWPGHHHRHGHGFHHASHRDLLLRRRGYGQGLTARHGVQEQVVVDIRLHHFRYRADAFTVLDSLCPFRCRAVTRGPVDPGPLSATFDLLLGGTTYAIIPAR